MPPKGCPKASRRRWRRARAYPLTVGDGIRFAVAPDGVRVAWDRAGEGPPLVRAATWLTHLEYDVAVYQHWLTDLTRGRSLVRYDMRGCGLSDRGPADVSLEARVEDLAAVVDGAGLQHFDLLGVSGGGPVSVVYAARHPGRVRSLVLYGSYARGRATRARHAAAQHEQRLLVELTRVGWGRNNPGFRRVFSSMFMPDASAEEVDAFDEVQRRSADPDTAARIRQATHEIDIESLAAQVRVPTLVLHVREDAAAPFEEGRRLAGLIPGAQFVPLEGRNHILGPDDPAWQQFVAHLDRFLDRPRPLDPLAALTGRERAVLALVAEGLDNDGVADRLSLSPRTVERHLSNIYTKLGVTGKAARAAAAARFAGAR